MGDPVRWIVVGTLVIVTGMAAATYAFCRLHRAWREQCARWDASSQAAFDHWARGRLAESQARTLQEEEEDGRPLADEEPNRYVPLLPEERYAHFQVVREAGAVVEDLLALIGPLYLDGDRMTAGRDH